MCGKCVCDECSKGMRRLCQKDLKFYRICDYCDNKIMNKHAEEAFKSVLDSKENQIKRYRQKIEELAEKTKDRAQRKEALGRKVYFP